MNTRTSILAIVSASAVVNLDKLTVFRVDMDDRTGTAFCWPCAEDAMQSGLFRR